MRSGDQAAPAIGRVAGCLLAAIACTLGPSATAAAATVELAAVRDNTLYQIADGSLSDGQGAYFFAGRSNEENDRSRRRGLLAFEVAAAVPAGSVVTGVTLHLNMSRTSGAAGTRIVSLRRAQADWGEGTSNANGQEGQGAPATTGDATWLHRFYPSQSWSSAGGDFAASASASTAVTATGRYSWSGSGMVADVQSWLDAPAGNFGWVVLGDESTSRTAKRFDSREHGTSANRPRLVVSFTPPEQVGACCTGAGDCSLLDAAGCALAGGSYQGDGSSCTPNLCPSPAGACCAVDGDCTLLGQAACAAAGGAFQGAGSSCVPNLCPQPSGACCIPGQPGSCAALDPIACGMAGGSFQGAGSACQVDLCPYVDPLPRPQVAIPTVGSAGAAATYEIAAQQIEQRLHRDLPPTTLWGYGGSYPGPTIEAGVGEPVSVVWINDLRDGDGELRSEHLLEVDTCLHGPDLAGPTARIVTHLHGGHTPWTSDGHPLATILPGERQTFTYPNQQEPATLWYHDHALGITRLNVYLGLAGFYLLRDSIELALPLPAGNHEVPLVLQDRLIGADGVLQYPALWQEQVFGDRILVNGKVWPYLEVDRGWYRLRLLNGANGRTFTLALSGGLPLVVIGTDGGLLPAPVPRQELTLGPGERADVMVDFGALPAGTTVLLVNSAPAPYPGNAGVGVVPQVMQFRVGTAAGHATPPPASLRPLPALDEADSVATRTMELRRMPSHCGGGTAWSINGLSFDDPITDFPLLGTIETWRFVNRSGMSHPMHMHLSMFQILDRQPFAMVDGVVTPTGPRVPPAAHEAGWKDTVMVDPSEIVRIIAPFENYTGFYVYHCHMLEHEDHDMMRQFEVRSPVVFADGFETAASSTLRELRVRRRSR
jgi:FtsP/CotA-like multicopper oxidase with cupredoxin domain